MRPSLPTASAALRALAASSLLLIATGLGLGACEPSPRNGAGPGPGAGQGPMGARSGRAAAGSASATSSAGPGDAGANEAAKAGRLPEPRAVAPPPDPPIRLTAGGKRAVRSTTGMVSSVEPHATRAGVAVLERGGNAVDAAVAVAYALAVTHPQAAPLGGGGFMLVRLANGKTYAVDYRETCPAKANQQTNERMLARGAHGYASAPVPGVVAGLNLAHERWGSVPLAELLSPAIELAREGHPLGQRQSLVLAWHWNRVSKDPTFKTIFGRGEKPVSLGGRLRQKSLASTLEAIAKHGNAGFYAGEVATKIETAMRQRGGYVTKEDLASYRAVIREPLRFLYRGFEIHTMPPPSMGGIALASIMLAHEHAKAYEAPPGTALSIHLFAEASRRAYADRRSVAADPAFADPKIVAPRLARLLDPRYYAERTPAIDPKHATKSSAITPLAKAMPAPSESQQTTHFSVIDAKGNAVSCTTTLSAGFGAYVIPPGTGVILSNGLGAFSPTGINAIEPGKRPASSMTPAIVLQKGQVVALLGSPGGDTIPGTVAQVLRNLVDHGMALNDAVDQGRVHHQWLPDQLRVEKTRLPKPKTLLELEQRGHKVVKHIPQGDVNAILVDPASRTAYGYADPRQGGLALGPAPAPASDARPPASAADAGP